MTTTTTTDHMHTCSDRIAYLRSKICSWDFLPLDLDEKDLVQCVCMMINQVLEIPDLAEFRVPIS